MTDATVDAPKPRLSVVPVLVTVNAVSLIICTWSVESIDMAHDDAEPNDADVNSCPVAYTVPELMRPFRKNNTSSYTPSPAENVGITMLLLLRVYSVKPLRLLISHAVKSAKLGAGLFSGIDHLYMFHVKRFQHLKSPSPTAPACVL